MTASAAPRSSARELLVEPGTFERIVVAPEGDRPVADPLDGREQLGTGLLRDDLAEQRAEQPDLGRQRVAGAGRPDPERLGGDRRRGLGGLSVGSRGPRSGSVPAPIVHPAATFVTATFP